MTHLKVLTKPKTMIKVIQCFYCKEHYGHDIYHAKMDEVCPVCQSGREWQSYANGSNPQGEISIDSPVATEYFNQTLARIVKSSLEQIEDAISFYQGHVSHGALSKVKAMIDEYLQNK